MKPTGNRKIINALAALEESTRAIASMDDPRSVLKIIAHQIDRVMNVEDCSIILLEEAGKATVLVSHESPELMDRKIEISNYPEIQKVLETKEPLIIADVEHAPLLKEVADILKRKRIKSIVVLPVTLGGELLGILFLRLLRRGNPLERAPMAFLQSAANAVALALRSFRLRDKVRVEVEEKEQARKLAEQEERFKQRYQELFHAASDGLIIIDSHGKMIDANRKFERLTGYLSGEISNLTYLDLLPEEWHKAARNLLKEYRNSPTSRRAQFAIRKKDGELRRVVATIEPLASTPGQALLSLQDISEENELENQLRRTKDFLENLIRSSVDAILACDMKGTIMVFNEGAEKISGYKAEEVIGKLNIKDFYSSGGARDAMRRLRSHEYGGIGKLESSHYSLVAKSGDEIPINLSASIIYEDGREIASVGIFQDLRERIRIEKELRATQQRLIETEKEAALSELSGATAHELNQPLTSIMGYAELLLKRYSSDDPIISKAMITINQEAERMAEIVKKISHVSSYHTKDYVGRARILDLDRASRAPSRYENLFLSLRDGLLEFPFSEMGTLGECVFANPSAVQLFGAKAVSDLLGLTAADILAYPDEARRLEIPLQNAGFFEDLVFRARRADGIEIFISASANIVESEKSPPVVELLCRDVSARVHMEQELKRLKEFSENIVNNAPVGILTLDKTGVVTSMNDREQEIMTIPSKDLVVGKNLMELPTIKGTHLEQAIKQGLAGERITIRYQDFTNIVGKKLTMRVEGMPIRDESGQVNGGIIIIEDVSEERRAHLELEVIAEISRAATQAWEPKQLYKVLVQQLKRVLSFDAISIVRGSKEDPVLDFTMLYASESMKIPKTGMIKAKDTITRRIIGDRIPNRVEDYCGMPNLLFDEKPIAGAGIRSAMNVPLVTQDHCLGTLNMGSVNPNAYSPKDLDFFKYVANEFALALQNTLLVEELREKNALLEQKSSYLETMLRAGRGFRITMNETEVVNRFVENIEQLFPSPHILVGLVDPQAAELVPVFARQLPGEAVLERRPLDPQLKKSILQGRDYIYYPSLKKVKSYKPELPDARSALIVPLHTGGELLGEMRAESHHTAPFTREEIDLFVLMAQQMSATLRNTRLYEQTRHLEKQQQELIENANALIAAIDSKGAVIIFNRSFEIFSGYKKEEVIGKRIVDLIKSPVNKDRIKNINSFLRSEQYFRNFIFDFHHKNGEWVKGVFNAGIQRDTRGKVQQFIFVGYDVTERDMLEKQLVQSAKMASLGQMAAGVAHELSNPLTYISSFVQLMQKSWEKRMDDPEAVALPISGMPHLEKSDFDHLTKIRQGAERIENLLSNLMSFSRLDVGDIEDLDINTILDQALSFSEYEISRGKVKVVREFGKDLAPVRGVRSHLQQVFINLLTNAGHALREKGGGKVIVKSSSVIGGLVQVEIIDDGPGIPPDKLEHIFEPFFTTKARGEGTGLGLSIVHDIVIKHGGHITVNSAVGEGTTFSVTLPPIIAPQ